MAVHDLLRELVETRGAGVVGDADQFRGALDDFLDEHEATRGEINLLVDAVRLGAVNRVATMLDHGADPAAALDEVALGLARDRGADSTTGARWALGVITYALGKAAVDQVPARPGSVGAPPAPVQPPAPAPAPPPAPPPAPTPAPGPPTEAVAPSAPKPPAAPTEEIGLAPPVPPVPAVPHGTPTGTLPEPPGPATETLPQVGRPAPPAPPPAPAFPTHEPKARRGRALVAAAAVLLLVGGGAVAAVVLTGDDDPDSGAADRDAGADDEDGSGGGDGVGSGEVVPGGALAPTQLVLPVREGDTNTLYVVDTETGEAEQLTSGPDDRLPTISPDRGTLLYLQGAGSGSAGGLEPHVLDLATGEDRTLFDATSPCEYATRPAFSPGGERLGVNCTDAEGEDVGTFVVDLDGQEVEQVDLGGVPRGALTWASESEVLLASYDGTEGAPSTIDRFDLDADSSDVVTAPDGGTDVYPDWSPERDGVLFQRSASTEDDYGQIWFLAPDGGDGEVELDVGLPAAQPTWSADASSFAFLAETADGERLASAPFADPGEVRIYDEVPGDPGAPAWGSR